MKYKTYLFSVIILIFYCTAIVFLPDFDLYEDFRGYILPIIVSVFLTTLNFHNVKNRFDYVIKLLFFIGLGYILRFMIFYFFNGYFDVDFRHLKDDWYILYIIIQIPVILVSSVLTFMILKFVFKKIEKYR